MNKSITPRIGFLSLLLWSLNLHSGEQVLHVKNAWTPAAPPGVSVHAGYFTIKNLSDLPIAISGFESPVYQSLRLHQSKQENGMMEMVEQDVLTLKPNERVLLEPGGMHLMLYGPTRPLAVGESVPMTLIYERDRRMDFILTVKKW